VAVQLIVLLILAAAFIKSLDADAGLAGGLLLVAVSFPVRRGELSDQGPIAHTRRALLSWLVGQPAGWQGGEVGMASTREGRVI